MKCKLRAVFFYVILLEQFLRQLEMVLIGIYRFLAPFEPLAFFSDLVLSVLTGSSLGAKAETYLLHNWISSSVVKLVASNLTSLSLEDSVK